MEHSYICIADCKSMGRVPCQIPELTTNRVAIAASCLAELFRPVASGYAQEDKRFHDNVEKPKTDLDSCLRLDNGKPATSSVGNISTRPSSARARR
jgi:hypothetical protein